jgi:hypothetical protein
MVHVRTANGFYTSPDEVVGSAIHALEWAENDPEGKRRLLRYALSLGVADSDAGRLIPAKLVFARLRDRARRRDRVLQAFSAPALIPSPTPCLCAFV